MSSYNYILVKFEKLYSSNFSLFAFIAFFGLIPNVALVSMIFSQYVVKVFYETAITPLTYYIVRKLKNAESLDVYDHGVNYNPFKLKE